MPVLNKTPQRSFNRRVSTNINNSQYKIDEVANENTLPKVTHMNSEK